jgi:hypothetical protein
VSGVSVVTTATTTLTAVTITTDTDATAPTRSVTITETQSPLSTNSVLVAQNFTGVLVEGGVAVTTTDAEGATFVTTLTGVPTGLGNATASPNVTEVVLTTTNSVGSTVVSTVSHVVSRDDRGAGTDGDFM